MRFSLKIMMTTTMSFILLLSGFINLSIGYAQEEYTNNNEIDIALEPDDVLFNVNNMKPGDWVPRTLAIKNAGLQDFTYLMTIENKGNDKLFNELLLEIKDEKEELYNGKLSEFVSLPKRELSATDEEELEITVRFPEHLGNEFQGTDSKFVFEFTAEGAEEVGLSNNDNEQIGNDIGSLGDGGSSLPNTATNIFNFLLIGSILITFGIVIMLVKRYKTGFTKEP